MPIEFDLIIFICLNFIRLIMIFKGWFYDKTDYFFTKKA